MTPAITGSTPIAPTGTATGRRWWRAVFLTGLGLLLATGVATTLLVTWVQTPSAPVPAGLPTAGPVTERALPLARGIRNLGAAVTMGPLLVAAVLLPTTPRSTTAAQRRLLGLAWAGALTWLIGGILELIWVYSQLAGLPVAAITRAELVFFLTELDPGRTRAATLILVAGICLAIPLIGSSRGIGLGCLLTGLALWPMALGGHAALSSDHDLAVNAQFLHVLAVTAWVGGLAGIGAARTAVSAEVFAATLRRYSRLAGWCYLTVAGSGLLAATTRLTWAGLDSGYGAVLGVKTALFLVLGAAGWTHRRWLQASMTRKGAGRGWFTRLATGELLVMGLALGAAAALSLTPPPEAATEPQTTAEVLLGFPLPPPLDGAGWFTSWRVDSFWAVLTLAGVVGYLLGVRRLRRRHDSWPVPRTLAWLTGCLGLTWATSGAPGVYGEVLFSAHMVQHMTIATAVPALLVLGAPVTLALRALHARGDGSLGAREWLLVVVHSRLLGVLGHPLVAAALFIVGLVAFYYSPLFEVSLRSHTAHLLMTLHFLGVGYLFANVVCGIDPGPRRPPFPLRALLLMATFAFHSFFSISLMASGTVLAEAWFTALGRDWGPALARDQYVGASLGWALGDYPLAILGGGLIWAWFHADQREGRRLDRQADRDGDQALTEYNTYLRTLAGPRPGTSTGDDPSSG